MTLLYKGGAQQTSNVFSKKIYVTETPDIESQRNEPEDKTMWDKVEIFPITYINIAFFVNTQFLTLFSQKVYTAYVIFFLLIFTMVKGPELVNVLEPIHEKISFIVFFHSQ